jgi:hypothetical protein
MGEQNVKNWFSWVSLGALVALLGVGCGVDGKDEGEEVAGVARQALSTSWTGPWGSNTATVSSGPGTSGKSGGVWIYAERSGLLYATEKWTDTDDGWMSAASTQISGAPAVAVTNFGTCDVIAWKDSSSTMTYAVEVQLDPPSACVPGGAETTVSGTIASPPAVGTYVDGSNLNMWAIAAKNSGNCSGGWCLQWNRYVAPSPLDGGFGSWTERTDGTMKTGLAPAAISRSSNSVDVYVVGTTDAMYRRTITVSGGTTTWSSWESLGGGLSSDPGVGSNGSSSIDLCAKGGDNAIWCKTFNGTNWTPWCSCGGTATSGPEVFYDGSGNTLVYTRGSDNRLWGRQCNPADRTRGDSYSCSTYYADHTL